MDRFPESTLEQLPDKVLATILKLVADAPIPAWNRAPPFPVTASRLSRRFRAVTIASPQVWTHVRLSHRSRSWSWAAECVKYSKSHPLDISISLEAYSPRHGYEVPIPIDRALAILGPHLGRWKTLSLRCWRYQIDTLRQLMLRFPGAASQLQSAHISLVDYYYWEDQALSPLAQVFGGPAFHSLRANARLDLTDLTSFQGLHTLDIGFDRNYHPDALRGLFGPSSPLRTLIIRDLAPAAHFVDMPVEASTISSLAVSFSLPFHSRDCHGMLGGFEDFTNTFAFPNLEYLEIIGGFTAAVAEPRILPAKLDAPFFPHLRTLRLENIEFSGEGIALMQSFSPEITSLELIHTTGYHHLLDKSGGDAAWPALRSLTVETSDKVTTPKWLSSFLTMRMASLGAGRRILNLTLPLWMAGIALPIELRPEIRWLYDGPSPALVDGLRGHRFYLDGCDLRARDFEHVQVPECRCCLGYLEWNREQEELEIDDDLRRADEMIAETFKLAGEFTRAKGMRQELRRETHRNLKAGRRFMGRRKRQRCDIIRDFSC